MLSSCLSSITNASPPPDEIILVADGGLQEDIERGEAFGVQVIPISGQSGPATARNLGASHATGDILFFVDADVAPAPNVIAKLKKVFEDNSSLAAVIGSYDDTPSETNFLSQYRNLLHHYVHQSSQNPAFTFWGACGAIRRQIFFSLNGFDESFGEPSIEDIELGYRITKAGYRIILDKTIFVKHLKRWEVGSLLYTDIFKRALPWSTLIINERKMIDNLNLTYRSRISIILVGSLLMAIVASAVRPVFFISALFCAFVLLFLNKDIYKFFYSIHGPLFMLKTIPWHWLYYLYSGAAFIGAHFLFICDKIRKGRIL